LPFIQKGMLDFAGFGMGHPMKTWIVLFRGINVSGTNIVPMAELRALMVDIGYGGAQTYIQSGNLLFSTDHDADMIRADVASAVEGKFGFEPRLMLFSLSDFEAALKANPFAEAAADAKSVHLFFMEKAPVEPDTAQMNSLKAASEGFELLDNIFYLHAPDGIGRSKLAARAERLLGVPATGRNWRSAMKILELAQGL